MLDLGPVQGFRRTGFNLFSDLERSGVRHGREQTGRGVWVDCYYSGKPSHLRRFICLVISKHGFPFQLCGVDMSSLGGWALTNAIESDAIFSMLFKQTDRAAAIIACVLVEDRLETMLKNKLRESSQFDKLFGVSRPLHFFGARNQLAYLMGIYGKPFFQELQVIGTIRNKFAHLVSDKGQPVSNFESEPVVRRRYPAASDVRD